MRPACSVWFLVLAPCCAQELDGVELFSGVAALTRAFVDRGYRMTCVDITYMDGAGPQSHGMDINTPAGFASAAQLFHSGGVALKLEASALRLTPAQ